MRFGPPPHGFRGMTAFTGAPALRFDPGCRIGTLLEDFGFEGVIAPAGFRTDGTSMPRPLWWLEPPFGPALWAAIIHDLLYALRRAGTPHPAAPTRRKADALFRRALIEAGISRPRAWLMWAGVRLFGRRPGSPRVNTTATQGRLRAAFSFSGRFP